MTDEQAVVASIEGYWRTWVAANDPPNPDHPDLAKYATGPALENARQVAAKNETFGLSYRHAEPSQRRRDVLELDVSGDRARVVSCEIDDGLVVHTSSGGIDDDQVISSRVATTLIKVDGAWKVERTEFEYTLEGGDGCER